MLITIYVLKAFSYTIVIMWIEHAVITLKVKTSSTCITIQAKSLIRVSTERVFAV